MEKQQPNEPLHSLTQARLSLAIHPRNGAAIVAVDQELAISKMFMRSATRKSPMSSDS
jgi:hypothetical protein